MCGPTSLDKSLRFHFCPHVSFDGIRPRVPWGPATGGNGAGPSRVYWGLHQGLPQVHFNGWGLGFRPALINYFACVSFVVLVIVPRDCRSVLLLPFSFAIPFPISRVNQCTAHDEVLLNQYIASYPAHCFLSSSYRVPC